MSATRSNGLVLFDSIHFVLTAEKILKKRGIWIDLVPIPRGLSSDCGLAIEFRLGDLAAVREGLAEGGGRWQRICIPTENGYRQSCEE